MDNDRKTPFASSAPLSFVESLLADYLVLISYVSSLPNIYTHKIDGKSFACLLTPLVPSSAVNSGRYVRATGSVVLVIQFLFPLNHQ